MRISSINLFNQPMKQFSGHEVSQPIQSQPLFTANLPNKLPPQRTRQQPLTPLMLNKTILHYKPALTLATLLILFSCLLPIPSPKAENSDQAETIQQPKSKHETRQSQSPEPLIYHKRYRHINPKTGYRTSYYKAGLPKSVPGGTRITLKEAHQHYIRKSALFLDVMAHTGTGPDPIDGHWRLAEPRQNIKGSTWLADVGTGTLSTEMIDYLKTNLKQLTKADKSTQLIIYCTADCWMAWNAVQRISRLGYTNLLWFPEGSDDWKDAGYPLENATPVPLTIRD